MLSTKKAIKKKKAKKKEKTLSTKKAIKKKKCKQLKTVIAHPTNRAKYSFCLNFLPLQIFFDTLYLFYQNVEEINEKEIQSCCNQNRNRSNHQDSNRIKNQDRKRCTGCSLNIVFFRRFLKIFLTLSTHQCVQNLMKNLYLNIRMGTSNLTIRIGT